MREILFRGKRIDCGAWVYGSLATYNDGTAFIHYPWLKNNAVVKKAIDPSTVGQYTGLKDKTGNYIFEGDIVELRCSCDPEDRICTVTWDDDTARFVLINPWLVGDFLRYRHGDLVVIGNIHDNPEMMEAGEC